MQDVRTRILLTKITQHALKETALQEQQQIIVNWLLNQPTLLKVH